MAKGSATPPRVAGQSGVALMQRVTHGIDLRYWDGAADVRRSLRSEGFELIDVHAELASMLCHRAFAPRDYLAESDARALFRLRYAVTPDKALLPEYPNTLNKILNSRLHSMSSEETHRQYYGVLEAQKVRELKLLSEDDTELLVRKSDMRKFVRKVAERNGFRHVSKRFPPLPSLLVKEMSNAEITGFFNIDSGGNEAIVTPSGFPLPPMLKFYLSKDPYYHYRMSLEPWQIITGMSAYGLTAGAIDGNSDPRTGERPIESVPAEFWSDIIKLGVVAYIRFFDLFLQSVDAAAVRCRPN